jgi:transcriptional regulator with XRE-family HTH domain
MDIDFTPLKNRLWHLKYRGGADWVDIAEGTGVHPSMISKIANGITKRPDITTWFKLRASKYAMPEPPLSNAPAVIPSDDSDTIQHIDIIRGFQNRRLAREINSLLLEIERINPQILEKIKYRLEGMLDAQEGVQQQASAKKRGA